ncbi:MAG: hypothetical protein KAR18_02835 [Spirochaetes bacterium]|nr:hypothetical protein [Spirochaetota bacterium]
MKLYKPLSFIGMLFFAFAGVIFLFFPEKVFVYFNTISRLLGMSRSPVKGIMFYCIFTVGYLFTAALIAFFMYRYPENRHFPLLLTQGQLVVTVVSLAMFLAHKPYLIYAVSFILNGIIGSLGLVSYIKIKKLSDGPKKGKTVERVAEFIDNGE